MQTKQNCSCSLSLNEAERKWKIVMDMYGYFFVVLLFAVFLFFVHHFIVF